MASSWSAPLPPPIVVFPYLISSGSNFAVSTSGWRVFPIWLLVKQQTLVAQNWPKNVLQCVTIMHLGLENSNRKHKAFFESSPSWKTNMAEIMCSGREKVVDTPWLSPDHDILREIRKIILLNNLIETFLRKYLHYMTAFNLQLKSHIIYWIETYFNFKFNWVLI